MVVYLLMMMFLRLNSLFTEKLVLELKSWILISIYAIKVLLLHTKGSLKVTQRAEE